MRNKVVYSFHSASLHHGTDCQTGHFTSIRGKNGGLYYFDDENSPSVLQFHSNRLKSSSVHFLMFKENFNDYSFCDDQNKVVDDLDSILSKIGNFQL